jgi:hypothetical protein
LLAFALLPLELLLLRIEIAGPVVEFVLVDIGVVAVLLAPLPVAIEFTICLVNFLLSVGLTLHLVLALDSLLFIRLRRRSCRHGPEGNGGENDSEENGNNSTDLVHKTTSMYVILAS